MSGLTTRTPANGPDGSVSIEIKRKLKGRASCSAVFLQLQLSGFLPGILVLEQSLDCFKEENKTAE